MRTAFIHELTTLAREIPEIFLVVGDLGYSVVEPFAEEFPDRFLNAGVAEQNMTGLAAGLASEGYHVFTYSIANFPVLRCLEQIRNDICYHNLPVTVVAVGAGLAYGNLGYSHHGVQDIAALAGLPNLTLLSPADPGETRACVRHLASHPGPAYLRLGKAGEPDLHSLPVFPGHLLPVVVTGGEIALVATGSVLSQALEAAEQSAKAGEPVDVFSCPWLKPLSADALAPLENYQAVITIEEHVEHGGLGDLLRRLLGPTAPFVSSIAIPDDVNSGVGSQSFLRKRAGLDAANIASVASRLRATVRVRE